MHQLTEKVDFSLGEGEKIPEKSNLLFLICSALFIERSILLTQAIPFFSLFWF